MGKSLYLESVAGVAGDMFTAAFVDAGLVTIDELNGLPPKLGLTGVKIETENVLRATVTATRLAVRTDNDEWKGLFSRTAGSVDSHHHHHHGHHHDQHHHDNTNLLLGNDRHEHWHVTPADIDRVIGNSSLPDATKESARKIFRLLAEAEAAVHGVSVDEAAFHELGTVDSIMDVVMAAFCIQKVSAEKVFASPIRPGRGLIKIAHGTHPIPPPASARLLIGMAVAPTPEAITRSDIELSTPTGIAILKSLSPEFVTEMPPGKLLSAGSGSGTLDLGSFPNVFRVSVVETVSTMSQLPYERDEVVEIVCNIDDDTAEHLAWICERLLELGAFDVWQTPVTGKKGRISICLSVLADRERLSEFADWLLRHSTTFGVRYRFWDRLKLSRNFEERDENGRKVRYKIGTNTTGEKLKEKLEFEDWKPR